MEIRSIMCCCGQGLGSSMIVSMNMPQKTPNAVMMLRLRFLLIVCQISSQRSKSNIVSSRFRYLLCRIASIVLIRAARRAGT